MAERPDPLPRATTGHAVALIDLGRASASGARRRLAGLHDSVRAAGFEPVDVAVLPTYRATSGDVRHGLRAVIAGRAVPETLAWSPRRVRAYLDTLQPHAVVCITSRCFHPDLVGPWRLVLDFVDRLSVSYADRSRIASTTRERVQYRALAGPQRRFERHLAVGIDAASAAGRSDAEALGVAWLPIPVAAAPPGGTVATPTTDVVFVGTLDYPPNIEAVERLASIWPAVLLRRPHTSAMIAGARPGARIERLVRQHHWELEADFAAIGDVLGRARLCVAPLRHASGIQIKVLDAASHGVAQIVDPVAAAGLDPAFPLRVCRTDEEWVDAIVDLLDHPAAAAELAGAALEHVRVHFSPDHVAHDGAVVLTGRPDLSQSPGRPTP